MKEMLQETLRRCPRCEESKPVGDFGIHRARKDGLNLYCKPCIREKIGLTRAAMREMKLARKAAGCEDENPLTARRRVDHILRKIRLPADRVFTAIKLGAQTQKEIIRVTKLPNDKVCDALADLLLWRGAIRTAVIRSQRHYFVCEAESALAARKEMAMSFSAVTALMPGRNARKAAA